MLTFSSIAMILLVLIQRGRGGGLAGAFGGQGGQSALGVRAGDVFTKITVVVAVVWVLLAGLLGIAMRGKAANDKAGTTMDFVEDESDKEGDSEDGGPEVKKADEPSDPAATDGPLVVPANPGESTTPEATTPEATTPGSTSPEPATPEPATPEPTTPEPATPETTTPAPTTPEATTPEATSGSEDPKP